MIVTAIVMVALFLFLQLSLLMTISLSAIELSSINEEESYLYGSRNFYDKPQIQRVEILCRDRDVDLRDALREFTMGKGDVVLEEDLAFGTKERKTDETRLHEALDGHQNMMDLLSELMGLAAEPVEKDEETLVEDAEDVTSYCKHPNERPLLVATKMTGDKVVPEGTVTWVAFGVPRVGRPAIPSYVQVRYESKEATYGWATMYMSAIGDNEGGLFNSWSRLYVRSKLGDFSGTFVRLDPYTIRDFYVLGEEQLLRSKGYPPNDDASSASIVSSTDVHIMCAPAPSQSSPLYAKRYESSEENVQDEDSNEERPAIKSDVAMRTLTPLSTLNAIYTRPESLTDNSNGEGDDDDDGALRLRPLSILGYNTSVQKLVVTKDSEHDHLILARPLSFRNLFIDHQIIHATSPLNQSFAIRKASCVDVFGDVQSVGWYLSRRSPSLTIRDDVSSVSDNYLLLPLDGPLRFLRAEENEEDEDLVVENDEEATRDENEDNIVDRIEGSLSSFLSNRRTRRIFRWHKKSECLVSDLLIPTDNDHEARAPTQYHLELLGDGDFKAY